MTLKNGLANETQINQLIGAIEYYFAVERTEKTRALREELGKISTPFSGHLPDQNEQKEANRKLNTLKNNYINQYFPELKSVMFDKNGKKVADSLINETIKKAVENLALTKGKTTEKVAVVRVASTLTAYRRSSIDKKTKVAATHLHGPQKLDPAQQPTKPADGGKKQTRRLSRDNKPSAKIKHKKSSKQLQHESHLRAKLAILEEVSRDVQVKRQFAGVPEYMGFMLSQLASSSDADKESIIDACFEDLNVLIKNGINSTGEKKRIADYIVQKTATMLGAVQTTAKSTPDLPVKTTEVAPKPPEPPVVEEPLALNAKKIKKKSGQGGISPQIRGEIQALITDYIAHLDKQDKPSKPDADLKIKREAAKKVLAALEPNSDMRTVVQTVEICKEDLSFNRNIILRPITKLFGWKTPAWGSTGSKCVAKIEDKLRLSASHFNRSRIS